MDRPLDSLLTDLHLPGHRAVAEHWLGLYRRDGVIPMLSEIDALQFPRALADAWIIDASDDGRFSFRLMGETLVEWYGRNPKGMFYDEMFPPEIARVLTMQSQQVLARPCAGFQRVHTRAVESHVPRLFERLSLPLRNSAGERRHILGASVFNHDRSGDPAPEIDHWYPIP